jgi:hypothetical protein
MTKKEYQKTVWGLACANLGHPITNAFFYREEGVPETITDEQIIAECERILENVVTQTATISSV